MVITDVLNDFIRCWKAYNQKENLTDLEVRKAINRGDCFLVAITVHYVLLQKYQITTHIMSNRNHAWLHYEGCDYDTLEPSSYHPDHSANWTWSKGELDDVHEDTFADACNEWMSCDAHGGYLVKAFVGRYGLSTPPELQHCIDNAAEYERPEEIPILEGKAALVTAISL